MSPLDPLLAPATLLALAVFPAAAQDQLWIQQLGTPGIDWVQACAPMGTAGVYTAGISTGSLAGPSAGSLDAWLMLHDSLGNQVWARQIGTAQLDSAEALAADAAGGIYVAGHTTGSLAAPPAGNWDAWVARYDSAGSALWIRQLGTVERDLTRAAVPDGAGGVILCGNRGTLVDDNDVWLARYDAAGNELWTLEFGTPEDDTLAAAAPDGAGGLFVTGATRGALGGPGHGDLDPWLARYDGAGNLLWIRQDGSAEYEFASVAASDDAGGVYVGGQVGQADPDVWLARYDAAGGLHWFRTLGTPHVERLEGAAPDGSGGVHLGGDTFGSLAGPSAGSVDVWLGRYDAAGVPLCFRQLGTAQADSVLGAAPDGSGGVYLGGYTSGALAGPSSGQQDGWLARYGGVCEPCGVPTVYCSAKLNSDGCLPAISGTGTPSVSQGGGFTITTVNLLAGQVGVYFYGKSGASSAPFQGGTLCVQPPAIRTPPMGSGGSGACGGSFQLDFNAYVVSGGDSSWHIGQQVWLQAWSRDPGFAPPDNSSLSDALAFTLCP